MDISTLKKIVYNGINLDKLFFNGSLVWQNRPPSEVTFQIAISESNGDSLTQATEHVLESYSSLAGYRLEFQIFSDGVYGTESEVLETLIADPEQNLFSWINTNLFIEFAGDYTLLQLPFFIPHKEALRDFLIDEQGMAMKDLLGEVGTGLQIISMYPGVQYVVAAIKPVPKLEDFRGMKLAHPTRNPVWEVVVAGLGANPAVIATNELGAAIRTGVIDGAICTFDEYISQSLHETAPYLYKLQAWDVKGFVGSDTTVQKFQATEKESLKDALLEGVDIYFELNDQARTESEQRLVSEGAMIYEFDAAESTTLRDALEPVYYMFQEMYPEWFEVLDNFMNGYR